MNSPWFTRIAAEPRAAALVAQAVAAVDASEGSLLLLDGQALRFAVCCSPLAARLVGLCQPPDRGITGLAFQFQQPMLVNDVQTHPSFDSSVDAKTGAQTTSLAVSPVSSPLREYGALTAVNSRKGRFAAHDLERLQDVASELVELLEDLWEEVP